ncbi:MAG: hypothetical protein ACFFCI_23655, partial [Promethearchaeota archaeon]
MLRQVFIILRDKLVYQRSYAKGLDTSLFTNVYQKVKKVVESKFGSETGSYEFFEYKLSYIAEEDSNLIIIFVSGLGDNFDDIKPQLKKFKKEFLDFYRDDLNKETFEIVN